MYGPVYWNTRSKQSGYRKMGKMNYNQQSKYWLVLHPNFKFICFLNIKILNWMKSSWVNSHQPFKLHYFARLIRWYKTYTYIFELNITRDDISTTCNMQYLFLLILLKENINRFIMIIVIIAIRLANIWYKKKFFLSKSDCNKLLHFQTFYIFLSKKWKHSY